MASMDCLAKWEVQGDDCSWSSLTDEDAVVLEKAFVLDPKARFVAKLGPWRNKYEVDLALMLQINPKTKKSRSLRRAAEVVGVEAAKEPTASDPPPGGPMLSCSSEKAKDSELSASWEDSETCPATLQQIQILLDQGWADIGSEEADTINKNQSFGNTSFRVKSRKQTYEIDLVGLTQTNVATGKLRQLRWIDLAVDDDGSKSSDSSPKDEDDCDNVSARQVYVPEDVVRQQKALGAQSLRGKASLDLLTHLDPHSRKCFEFLLKNERRLCGEWAAFYHSYSFAALLYEVHAAVGAVLFRFRSQYATLPRILEHDFKETPNAQKLIEKFRSKFAKAQLDHHPEYRAVGLSTMCSLVATGPEASPPSVFTAGYSCTDLSFRSVLENLLESCYVPKKQIQRLARDIIELSEKHGLDVSQFGGKRCKSGKAGHLLQILIRRDLVDELAYAAVPYGHVDQTRQPLSKFMNSNSAFTVGQARVVAHPQTFMQATAVRLHVISADPTFHSNRMAFQDELTKLLDVILREPKLRKRAAEGIYGGRLPDWWTTEDQREVRAKMREEKK